MSKLHRQFQKLRKKESVSASVYTAIQVGVKLVVNLILGKFIALIAGAQGLFIIGQFQSLQLVLQNLANGATHNGIVNRLVANEKNASERNHFFQTGFKLTLVCSVIFAIAGFAFSGQISQFLFQANDYKLYIRIAFIVLPCIGMFQFLLSVITSQKNLKLLTYLQVANPLLLLLFVGVGLFVNSVEGLLLGLVLFPIPLVAMAVILFKKAYSDWKFQISHPLQASKVKYLFRFSIMTLLSVLSVALYQILLRDLLSENVSVEEAGFFESMLRISNLYVFFISMLFGNYFIPMFADTLSHPEKVWKTIFKVCAYNLGYIVVVAAGLLILAPFIIPILFTESFLVIIPFLKFMLIANGFKFLLWVLTNYFMTFNKVTWFAVFEALPIVFAYFLAKYVFADWGIKGIFIAETYTFAGLFLLALVVMKFVIKNRIEAKNQSRNLSV